MAAFNQVAFHHHAHNVFFTGFQLRCNIARHVHLFAEVFTAVGMAAVHHQVAAHAGFLKLRHRVFNVFRAVIRLFTATQNRMAVRVAAGVDNRRMTGFGYRQEVVRMIGGADGIDGDFQVAVRTVFKTDRAGEAAGQFAVYLAFSRARTNRAPRNQVGVVLRRNHVQEFSRSRHAHFVQSQQQLTRLAQAVVDVKRTVQVRIVNQAFPANGCTRFFKIHAHHNQQLFLIFFAQGQQFLRIFYRRLGIVNRAWADDNQQTVVAAVNQIRNLMTCFINQIGNLRRNRQLIQMRDWR